MNSRLGIKVFMILLIVIRVFESCSNDLEILAEPNPLPLVYCVIDPADSVYKVMLSRTFAGNRDVHLMAQDTDALYYKNAEVSMECWGSGYRVWKTDFHPTGATRDSGLFSSRPGYAFETQNVLSTFFGQKAEDISKLGLDYLRLVVKTPDLKETAYARISLDFHKQEILFPQNTYKIFNLCDTIPYYLKFRATVPGKYYELRCKFRYIEYTNVPQYRSVDFIIKSDLSVITATNKLIEISPAVFFRKLAACFPLDAVPVDYRKSTTLDLELYVGSENYKQYVDSYYSDNDHSYTLWNCFHGGIGLFALKDKTVLSDLEMDRWTKDSLANGMLTKHLKFVKW